MQACDQAGTCRRFISRWYRDLPSICVVAVEQDVDHSPLSHPFMAMIMQELKLENGHDHAGTETWARRPRPGPGVTIAKLGQVSTPPACALSGPGPQWLEFQKVCKFLSFTPAAAVHSWAPAYF